jgi:hypothetical protein
MSKEPTPYDEEAAKRKDDEVKIGSRSTLYNENVETFARTLLEVLGKYKSLREQRFAEFFATDEKDMSCIYIDYPPYQRAEAIYAHNSFLDEQIKCSKIKESVRIENYESGKEVSSSYETIRISREKYENFLTEGYQYFIWDGIRLTQELYFSGSSRYVRLYFRKADTEKVTEFITQLRLFMKRSALFKGEKLLFTRRGWVEVLEYPKLDWNDVILSPQTKREFELNLLTPLAEGMDCIIKGIPWRRGLLLGGLAGTGKTQVCRILCNQLKDVTVLWATPKAIQDEDDIAMLFNAARHYYPTLIIIEDIDFIGTSRDFSQDPSLGELLSQLDGNDPNFGIFVIATTNRPEMLDSALANRPSRFDVLIEFKLPDKESCKNLIKLFSKNMTFDKELDLENLALSMRDLTGAQIKESFVYAKLVAIYNKKETVAIEDVLKRAENYKVKNGAEAYRK